MGNRLPGHWGKRRIRLFACLSLAALSPCAAPPSFADTYQLVNPFNKQELRQFDWTRFPTDQQKKNLDPYVGEKRKKSTWNHIYFRDFKSEFGNASEGIQEINKGGNISYRIVISYLDDAYPKKCTDASRKLESAIGPPTIVVDKSNLSKMLLSKKSKVTMDWHTVRFQKQWFAGKTSIDLSCIGYGSNKITEAILAIILQEKARAKVLQPILWLACRMERTTRFRDGEIRKKREQEFIIGIDFNNSEVIRLDNSSVDMNANVSDQTVEFNLGKKKEPMMLSINRYTGSIFGEKVITVKNITANVIWDGECKKVDKAKKKF